MVFYRKYRPQIITDLDSEHVRNTLTAVLSKDIPHAFLFTGPKGLGKTSTARIVAKVVNCEKRAESKAQSAKGREKKTLSSTPLALRNEIEPCNTCDQCVSITNGTNLDVIEIDAASNRGIDEIRELKDKIRLAPLSAKKKVYIIDEVHMLTTEAFNALLKTLEEPPDHAMFILCTTEAHKVPHTILSRCTHIAFHKATEQELVRSFMRIVEGEKIAIDEDSLKTLAKLSDGGFRDGAKILEELSALADGEKITKEMIDEKYKVISIDHHLSEMIDILERKDTKRGIQLLDILVNQGVDMKFFVTELMQLLHQDLLAGIGFENTARKKTGFSLTDLRVLLTLLTQAYTDMKVAIVPQLPLELLLIDWQNMSEQNTGEVTVTSSLPSAPSGYAATRDKKTVSVLRKQVGDIAKIKALYGESKVVADVVETPSTTSVSLLHYSPSGEITKEWMDAFWRSLIAEMKKFNHTIAGVLRGCMVKTYDRKRLVIETAYKFHKEKLDDRKVQDILAKVCEDLTGNPVEISIVLKSN